MSDFFGQPHAGYEDEGGIPNVFGQYGVHEVAADVIDEEGLQPCVSFNTFMCETALSIEGTEKFIVQLQTAINKAPRL